MIALSLRPGAADVPHTEECRSLLAVVAGAAGSALVIKGPWHVRLTTLFLSVSFGYFMAPLLTEVVIAGITGLSDKLLGAHIEPDPLKTTGAVGVLLGYTGSPIAAGVMELSRVFFDHWRRKFEA